MLLSVGLSRSQKIIITLSWFLILQKKNLILLFAENKRQGDQN
jgi:hypothetical protein